MQKAHLAKLDDIDDISKLIQLSARILGREFYDAKTVESALQSAFGVDTQLIIDNTYYLIKQDNMLVACGGWSYRRTLFGSDNNNIRNPAKLNPRHDAAKIRAFFIHPNYARQGLGKILLTQCEQQALKHGFTTTQLMSTLSGVAFYQKNGYIGKNHISHKMNDGNEIQFLPMTKKL